MTTLPRRFRELHPIFTVMALIGAALTVVLAGAYEARAAIVFSQDFESGLGSNETTSGSFRVNNTNAPVNNGTLMMGHPSNYAPYEYSFYEVRLNLSGYQQTRLQFDFRAQIYTHFDRFNVQASTCPINPPNNLITPLSGMTYSTDHTHRVELGTTYFDSGIQQTGTAVFDLSPFDRSASVCIRFQFGSDGGSFGSVPGINIDNVQVTGTALCYAVNAIDDQFAVINDGTTALLAVLANEGCNGDQPLTVVQQAGDLDPDRGGVAITDGTRVRYTPASGFVGFEEFTYTVQDAGLAGGGNPPAVDRDTARVVVNVLQDIEPIAADDAATTQQGQSVVIDVLDNDTLGNGAPNALAIKTQPSHGTVAIQTDQTIRYSPNYNYFGEDVFEYRLTDQNGDSAVATVTVGVYFQSGQVSIDIDPSDAGNNLNLRSGPGSGFEVAILSVGPYFDAPAQVDPLTLKFGPRQANIWGDHGRARDVDGDGDDDLVVKFLTDQTGIACGDTSASLSGRTYEYFGYLNGTDAVNTFNCPRVRKRY
jgi:hypothetical protein